jgi:transposase
VYRFQCPFFSFFSYKKSVFFYSCVEKRPDIPAESVPFIHVYFLSWTFFHFTNKNLKSMSNKKISMTQVALIQQLKEQGHSIRSISRKTGLHRKTVTHYFNACVVVDATVSDAAAPVPTEEASPLPSEQARTDSAVSTRVLDNGRLSVLIGYFPYFDRELSRIGVTRQLLWEEYRESHPDGYGYTQFCEHYSRHRSSLPVEAVMHLSHIFGDRLQVDFAGKSLSWIDRSTGEIIKCPVLVCVLPASGFTYVEALSSAHSESLFCGLNRCLEYFGGVPRNVLSDNMRQFVIKNTRYEFTFTDLAVQWSLHYGCNLEATRPYRPRDKASVESHVRIVYQRIYARLRDEEFYSLSALNHRVRELLDVHNDCPSSRGGESRRDVFLSDERSLLKSLPPEAFVVRHRTKAKVQKNYHVELGEDKHYYSVPFRYIGQQTVIVYDRYHVEVYIDMERIAFHGRNFRQWGYSTVAEHMPASHAYHLQRTGWTREYFENISRKAGVSSAEVFKRVMDAKDFVEQSYRSCTGLKSLMENYGNERFENACRLALEAGHANYGIIKNILQNATDKSITQEVATVIPFHENIRGADEYK